MVDTEALLEKLAELEHDQWMVWSQGVAPDVRRKRRKRWQQCWIPYAELSEEDKELDRIWARKIMAVLSEFDLLPNDS